MNRILGFVATLLTFSGFAAPTLQVNFNGLDEEPTYLDNVKAFVELYENNNKPVEVPVYTDYLAKAGISQIQQALHPFGYYQSSANYNINKTAENWQVNYDIQLGKPVSIESIDVQFLGDSERDREFTELKTKFPLKVGDKLDQPKYSNFKEQVLMLATRRGYFDGQFEVNQILLNDALDKAAITLHYQSGKRYEFDTAQFQQDILDDEFIIRYANYKKGDPYDTQQITELQKNLYNSGYIKLVEVDSQPNAENKLVPINYILTPNKNKKYTYSIGYGTDTGARLRFDFERRWVNKRGHRFTSEFFIAEKVQEININYIIPSDNPVTDYSRLYYEFAHDTRGDYDFRRHTLGGAYHDKIDKLERELGIFWNQESFNIGNDNGNATTLSPYVLFKYVDVDDPLNVSDGLSLETKLTVGVDTPVTDMSFYQAIAKAKYAKKITPKHKINLQAGIGQTWVDDFHKLPPSFRFFLGGDRTIRGFKFDKIGDIDSSGDTVGGNKMLFSSVEYEYFFNDSMAIAAFVDAGDAYESDGFDLNVGAGFGFHYYSPIGPIKVDLAHGFDEPGDEFRLHLTIGPDF